MIGLEKKRTKFIIVIIIGLFVSSSIAGVSYLKADFNYPIAHLVLLTGGGGVRPDYGFFISQDLYKIGIVVTVKVVEWSVFVNTLLVTHDYDLVILGLSGGGYSPD